MMGNAAERIMQGLTEALDHAQGKAVPARVLLAMLERNPKVIEETLG